MKVLFLRSGNNGIDPISTRQGESLRKAGIEIYYFDITGKGLAGYLRNICPLGKFIRQTGIELIHAHYSLCGFLASLSFQRRIIITSLMGSDVLEVNRFTLMVTRIYARYLWAITIVKSSEMHKKLGVKNALVIPNGIDMDEFAPMDKTASQKELGWNTDAIHILFGSDPRRPEKNFNLAEQSLEMIKERFPEGSIKIHFLCGLQYDQIAKFYCASDLLLMTSLHEGSSNTIKEAMACNCPIVTTDVGDAREVIQGTEGCYTTTFDHRSVAKGILSAIEFGRRTTGREKMSHMSSVKTASQIVGLYNSLL